MAGPLLTYRLKFEDDGLGVDKIVEFMAPDPAKALMIAGLEAANRYAELWQGNKRICRLRRTEEQVWLIK
ncbi:hypothetical protein [Novosphingobium malaysiense]|uniref:Uncharacterized protein n=1 Tax=Novosphingobium malaysiense TaxID=1348853 RepID=A0A0B1ZJZ4_9SPHN|nr:hypothetical protein [Novosphingobium malaysiense]KHK90891.1 hypothetical protein LK12_07980 [Novosphingobium malaysiense]